MVAKPTTLRGRTFIGVDMGLNALKRMREIAKTVGGLEALRMKMKQFGYEDWDTLTFYPIVAYFPRYMVQPDVLGIAIRNGFSFKVIFGCITTDYQELNEWFRYVCLHDNYDHMTEALLDHHKAMIATEVDWADAELMGWDMVLQEVIDGIRPTKFDVDDDDFLVEDEVNITFGVSPNRSDSPDIIGILDALREFTSKNPKRFIRFVEQAPDVLTYTIDVEEDADFDDSFKENWA